jgi:ubiquinone/menaquinone biosynthesis C-methylase UbiE
MERAQELDLNLRHDIAGRPDERLPYEDSSFDVAIVAQVLMHQRPEVVQQFMAELIRVSHKVVAIAAYGSDKVRLMNHVFHHDYPRICSLLSCEMNHVQAREGILYFVYNRA